ncbi:hypothetical protein LZ318_05585 [Saccharopolyspora indica]|uniref:hypothetical protein n=1 Tax=Saccharopolyspora indica TaxID=1229659 RepID=UPI0022EB2241|nr:hypothetical protein [Saccharopolyspora indica]MDA3646068.1 hypothetical protein [Saccharopolyspora indica]
MSGATRSRVRRSSGVGLCVLAVGIGLAAAGWILPSSTAPGYTSVPNTCESVSPQSLEEAFEPRQAEIYEQRHGVDGGRHSSKCQWRTEGPVRGERKTRLQVEMAIEFDREARPDTAYVDQFLDYLELEPGAAEVPGLDARAVLIRSPRDVQLVAAKDNMTIAVRYSAAPAAELEPVARRVVEELLVVAG